MSDDLLAQKGIPPPYWAFAWLGGQALARFVLDHPDLVAGRCVLDIGSGSGIVAIAAAKAGAARMIANDIDPFAHIAIELNARANGISVESNNQTAINVPTTGINTIFAGDVCYELPFSTDDACWLKTTAQNGIDVLIGDPDCTYLPKADLRPLAV